MITRLAIAFVFLSSSFAWAIQGDSPITLENGQVGFADGTTANDVWYWKGVCDGGTNDGSVCSADSDCPGGTCGLWTSCYFSGDFVLGGSPCNIAMKSTFSEFGSCLGDDPSSEWCQDAAETKGVNFAAISVDCGACQELEIPHSATVDIDEIGDIGIDSSADQLIYGGASGTNRVLTYRGTVCVTVENLLDSDDNFLFWSPVVDVTVTDVWCHCRGTCTTTNGITLEDGGGNSMTHTAPTCAEMVCDGGTNDGNACSIDSDCPGGVCGETAVKQSVTDNSVSQVAGASGVAFSVGTISPTSGDTYTLCLAYIVDRK